MRKKSKASRTNSTINEADLPGVEPGEKALRAAHLKQAVRLRPKTGKSQGVGVVTITGKGRGLIARKAFSVDDEIMAIRCYSRGESAADILLSTLRRRWADGPKDRLVGHSSPKRA